MSLLDKKSAEQLFREAFERLKINKPEAMPSGTAVTQNNVAREACRDPSALKKDRYPLLVLEIQAYVASEREHAEADKRTSDNRSRSIKQKLKDCQRQRDKLSSIVAAQDIHIEELYDEIDRLKAGTVVKFKHD